MRAIVSVTNDLYTDNRVKKVCQFLCDQGYEVVLVGRRMKKSVPLPKRGYRTVRMKLLFEKGALFYAAYNFRLFLFLITHKSDVLVSNDLDTLLGNYLASMFKRKTRLVYDSHELFTEVPELINRPKVQRIWLRIEKWIFPKLNQIYTVNESIAEIYSRKYNKPISIVRNISPAWRKENLKSKEELGIPEGKKLIIMQGAGINIDRGGEEAVEAMASVNAVLLIVGDGDVVPALKEYVKINNLQEKVLFFGRKPYEEMMNYTFHADIGLTLDKPRSLNYTYSLPNKVFDYLHAETPIIATNIKEVAKIVNDHGLGVIIDHFDVKSLTTLLTNTLSNQEALLKFKENCRIASQELNWENESKALNSIYPKVD